MHVCWGTDLWKIDSRALETSSKFWMSMVMVWSNMKNSSDQWKRSSKANPLTGVPPVLLNPAVKFHDLLTDFCCVSSCHQFHDSFKTTDTCFFATIGRFPFGSILTSLQVFNYVFVWMLLPFASIFSWEAHSRQRMFERSLLQQTPLAAETWRARTGWTFSSSLRMLHCIAYHCIIIINTKDLRHLLQSGAEAVGGVMSDEAIFSWCDQERKDTAISIRTAEKFYCICTFACLQDFARLELFLNVSKRLSPIFSPCDRTCCDEVWPPLFLQSPEADADPGSPVTDPGSPTADEPEDCGVSPMFSVKRPSVGSLSQPKRRYDKGT